MPIKLRCHTLASNEAAREIRSLLKSKSGKRFLLAKIPDTELLGLFNRLRKGTPLKDCADWLQKRGICTDSTADSLRKMIATFKKRLSPILLPPTLRQPELPELKTLAGMSDLERVTTLCERYSEVLNGELLEASSGGALNPNISKLSNGLAALLRVKHGLEAEEAKRLKEAGPPVPEQDQKLYDMLKGTNLDNAQSVLEKARKGCVQIEQLPDGSYRKIVDHAEETI